MPHPFCRCRKQRPVIRLLAANAVNAAAQRAELRRAYATLRQTAAAPRRPPENSAHQRFSMRIKRMRRRRSVYAAGPTMVENEPEGMRCRAAVEIRCAVARWQKMSLRFAPQCCSATTVEAQPRNQSPSRPSSSSRVKEQRRGGAPAPLCVKNGAR